MEKTVCPLIALTGRGAAPRLIGEAFDGRASLSVAGMRGDEGQALFLSPGGSENDAKGPAMDRLQQLSDIEDLRLLKAAYFYTLDHKLWSEWIALFTEDAVLKVDLAVTEPGAESPPARTLEGASTILTFISQEARAATARTVHHGHTFEHAFLSDTEATGRWAMEDIVDHPTKGLLRGYGHYHERYRKQSGRWKFSAIHLTRLRLDLTAASAALAS